MPVDPQLQEVMAELREIRVRDLADMTVEEARRFTEEFSRPAAFTEPVAEISDLMVAARGYKRSLRLYRPSGSPKDGKMLPGVVYFHGGGWVGGSTDSHDRICRALANRSGCMVASVGYGLAPENPFPVAVEDAYAATCWVSKYAGKLGMDPQRMGVAGDSAGGNLAAVVCLLANLRGAPDIAHQLLVYPATDMSRSDWPSYRESSGDELLSIRDMRWFENHYLNDGSERLDFRASPLIADSHADLPPATILTANYDPLRDEGEAYAEKLLADGVPTTVKRYDGMAHGFFGMFDRVDEADRAVDFAASSVSEALLGRLVGTV